MSGDRTIDSVFGEHDVSFLDNCVFTKRFDRYSDSYFFHPMGDGLRGLAGYLGRLLAYARDSEDMRDVLITPEVSEELKCLTGKAKKGLSKSKKHEKSRVFNGCSQELKSIYKSGVAAIGDVMRRLETLNSRLAMDGELEQDPLFEPAREMVYDLAGAIEQFYPERPVDNERGTDELMVTNAVVLTAYGLDCCILSQDTRIRMMAHNLDSFFRGSGLAFESEWMERNGVQVYSWLEDDDRDIVRDDLFCSDIPHGLLGSSLVFSAQEFDKVYSEQMLSESESTEYRVLAG